MGKWFFLSGRCSSETNPIPVEIKVGVRERDFMAKHLYSIGDIKKWLKNLDVVLYPPRGKRYDEVYIKGNRPYDGVTAGRLTAIMLTSAIEALPNELQQVLRLRWVLHAPLKETLGRTGLSKDQYYYCCDKAAECITYHCNGQLDEFQQSLKRYLKKAA